MCQTSRNSVKLMWHFPTASDLEGQMPLFASRSIRAAIDVLTRTMMVYIFRSHNPIYRGSTMECSECESSGNRVLHPAYHLTSTTPLLKSLIPTIVLRNGNGSAVIISTPLFDGRAALVSQTHSATTCTQILLFSSSFSCIFVVFFVVPDFCSGLRG
jgi:hypothetical protein